MASASLALKGEGSDYPILITCQNDVGDRLDVGMSLAKQSAYCSYEKAPIPGAVLNPVLMLRVYVPSSNNSGAGVQIKSQSGTGESDSVIEIRASMNTTDRMTHYTKFMVNMTIGKDGAYTAQKLSFAQGNDTEPESVVERILEFSSMKCSTKGL
jgi:hypothetical protein